MITEVNAASFQKNPGEMLNHVQYGNDSIVISENGKPVAALVDAELFARIRRSKKLATALQGCRSNSIGKGFLSPPQWLRSKPRLIGRGLNLRTFLTGGVSNRS